MKKRFAAALFLALLVNSFSHAQAEAKIKLGDRIQVRPGDLVPEPPKGTLWLVLKKTVEHVRTLHNTLAGFNVPQLEIEVVKAHGTMGHKLDLLEPGGYLMGSSLEFNYTLTLDKNRELALEKEYFFQGEIAVTFKVGESWQTVADDEDLPPLPEGYVWDETVPGDDLFEEQKGLTTFVLAKEDPDDFSLSDSVTFESPVRHAAKTRTTFNKMVECTNNFVSFQILH